MLTTIIDASCKVNETEIACGCEISHVANDSQSEFLGSLRLSANMILSVGGTRGGRLLVSCVPMREQKNVGKGYVFYKFYKRLQNKRVCALIYYIGKGYFLTGQSEKGYQFQNVEHIVKDKFCSSLFTHRYTVDHRAPPPPPPPVPGGRYEQNAIFQQVNTTFLEHICLFHSWLYHSWI